MLWFLSNVKNLTGHVLLWYYLEVFVKTNEENAGMENAEKTVTEKNIDKDMILTTNEVANVIGESYKTVAKVLNALATEGKIGVTEKLVNNRALKGFILDIADLQTIKDRFLKNKHLESRENAQNIQMVSNRIGASKNANLENDTSDTPNVKFYEVVKENAELTKELDKLKSEMQTKINENVRLDADLSMARSELKYITDKSSSMEAAFSEKKLEVERLNKVIHNKNIALIVLGAVLLIIVTIAGTIMLIR